LKGLLSRLKDKSSTSSKKNYVIIAVRYEKRALNVDICSACHPFFTGEMKFVDRQGRVDKFIKKRATAEAIAKTKKSKKKATQESTEPVKSYKQILQEQQAVLKQEKKATTTTVATKPVVDQTTDKKN